ncbi:Reticulocyte-binding protein 2 homolog a [Durusdinium trenchii]|uniref:Reticulocyte-binding protein 2 homolog a n=1 Tax=Durusdinium trenchii TaxID=1381693 RepID=A0ABP0RJD6_9DINO
MGTFGPPDRSPEARSKPRMPGELAALRGRLVALQRRQQAKATPKQRGLRRGREHMVHDHMANGWLELIFQESQQQLQHEIHAAREGNQTLVQQLTPGRIRSYRTGPAEDGTCQMGLHHTYGALAQEASAAAEAAAYAAELLAQGRAVEQLREASGELDQSAVGARARGVPRGPQAVEGFARQQVALEEQRLRRGIAQARQELDAARAQSDAKAFRNELLEEEVEALRTTREAQGKINAMSKSSSSAAMGAWQRASLALSEAELQQQLLSFEALGHAARSIRDSADSGASSISRRDDWSPERCLWASPKARGTAPLELSLSSSSQLQTSWTLEQRKSGSQDLDVALSMLIPKEADRNAHDNDPREGTGGSTWAMLAELASGSTHEKTIWEEVAQADAEVQCDDVYLLDMASWEAVKEEICQLERARNEQLMQELKEERERAASKHVESLAVEQGLRQELRAQEELLSESRTEEKRAASKQVETLTLQRELKEEQRAFAHQREKLLHAESLAKEEKRAASKQAETLTLQRELKEEQRAFAHQREKLLHEESLAKEEKRAAQKTPVEEHVARLTDELLDEQRAFAQQWETWLAKEESLERRAASSMESVARLTSHALKEEQRGFASQREKLLHEESLAKEEKAELDLCRAAATKREELFRNELSAAQTQTAAERARAASAAAARHRVEEAQRLRTLGAPSPAPSPARSPPIEPIAVREMALELKRSLSQQLPDKKPQPLPRRAHRSVGVPNGAIGLHRSRGGTIRDQRIGAQPHPGTGE